MKVKEFEFNKKKYRLEIHEPDLGVGHTFILYEHQFGDQKNIISQMINKIITENNEHGISDKVANYVQIERPEKKTNYETQTPEMAKELYDYLDRTERTEI